MMTFNFLRILIVIMVYTSDVKSRNNVCRRFSDYFSPENNPNCYYDPDTTLTPPELIKKYTGNVETHEVTSKDGYIVTMFRIPALAIAKGVILLHHSIATSSQIYLWQGNSSLAITLWRDGFDVWLANQRGTSFSDKHINMTTREFAYWSFGAHEMGVYDVNAELELIRKQTNNSKVIFLGHSLGSAIGLFYASMKPIEAKNYLKSMILLSPPCYFEHATSAITGFRTTLPRLIWVLQNSLQIGSPLSPFLPTIVFMSRIILRSFPIILYVVNLLILAFCGFTPNETDPTFFNFDAAVYGNNFSWQTLLHFFQIANSKHRFQMYDYGRKINLRRYGQEIPPLYPIEKISVPTLLVSSFDDSLVTVEGTENLFNELSPDARVHGHWKLSRLNHLDFFIGLSRGEIYVDRLLRFLNNL